MKYIYLIITIFSGLIYLLSGFTSYAPYRSEPSTYSLQRNIDEWEIKFIETPSRLDHYTPEQVKENLVRYIDRTKSPRRKEIKSSQNYLLIILVFSFVGYLREQTLKKQKNE